MKFQAFGDYVLVSETKESFEAKGFVVATSGKLKNGVVLSVSNRPWYNKWLEAGSEIVYYADKALPFDFETESNVVIINITDVVAFVPRQED